MNDKLFLVHTYSTLAQEQSTCRAKMLRSSTVVINSFAHGERSREFLLSLFESRNQSLKRIFEHKEMIPNCGGELLFWFCDRKRLTSLLVDHCFSCRLQYHNHSSTIRMAIINADESLQPQQKLEVTQSPSDKKLYKTMIQTVSSLHSLIGE